MTIGHYLRAAWAGICKEIKGVRTSAELRRVQRQQSIEHNANLLVERIRRCRTLKESYDIHDLIKEFTQVWGEDDVQVKGWYYSLFTQLHRKQEDIANKL